MRSVRSTTLLLTVLATLAVSSCDLFTGPDAGFEGQVDFQILGTSGRPFGLGISSQGKALALQLDRSSASRFNVSGDTILDSIRVGVNPIDVSFTRAGAFAYITMLGGTRVYEVDMATGAIVDSATFGQNHHRILVHPDDSRFWVLGTTGTMWTVDRESLVRTDSAYFGPWILRGISRRPSDGTLAISASTGVLLVNGATLDVLTSIDLFGTTQEIVHSKDGTLLFVAQETLNRIMVLDAATLARRDSILFIERDVNPFAMALSPDGNTLLASGSTVGAVAVIDAHSYAVRRILEIAGIPRRVRFSPRGGRAFVTNENGWIDVLR